MKAITIYQPYASLIAIGAKPYEFRGWKPPRRFIDNRIAIHAGKRPMSKIEVTDMIVRLNNGRTHVDCLHRDVALDFLNRCQLWLMQGGTGYSPAPTSHVVCIATLGEPRPGSECAEEFGGDGTYDSGPADWGWPMTDIEYLSPPIPAKGAQQIWEWNR